MTNTALPDVFTYLSQLQQQAGSDMFFSVGAPPQIKIEGYARPLDDRCLGPGEVKALAWQLMNDEQIKEFNLELEMNLAVDGPDQGRFRANIYYQRGEVAMVVRLIKNQIPPLNSLGLPPVVSKLIMQDRGLILVVGAAGSGKSTTLASLLNFRNFHRTGHIVCIEDPIEFLHSHQRSIIDQREVGLDTHSFANALCNVLREAPDVIMIGEIRDASTMQHALHYAESGHLCLATLHATSCRHAVERVTRFFPDESRAQVLSDLSQNLLALIGQRLIPGTQQRRAMAVELVLGTPHIRALIQRDEMSEVKAAVERALENGMQTFDQSLYKLVQEGRISLENALKFSDSRTDLTLKIRLDGGLENSSSPSIFEEG